MSGFLLRELAAARTELAVARRRLRSARAGREMWKAEALGYRALQASSRRKTRAKTLRNDKRDAA